MSRDDFKQMAEDFCKGNSEWSFNQSSMCGPDGSRLRMSNDKRFWYKRSRHEPEMELKGFQGIGDLLLIHRMMHGA